MAYPRRDPTPSSATGPAHVVARAVAHAGATARAQVRTRGHPGSGRATRASPRSPPGITLHGVGEPNVWSTARLDDGDGRVAEVQVNGKSLSCEIPADSGPEPTGATPFGLLAASLSSCTVMSVRTFLHRWRVPPGVVEVRVAVRGGASPMLERTVTVEAVVDPDLREQLAAEVDNTPVTRLLRDAVSIRTVLQTGPQPS